MKLTALLFLFAVTLIAGCHKNNATTNSEGTLSATVGSSAYTANLTYGVYVNAIPGMVAIGLVPAAKDTTFLKLSLPYPLPLNLPFSTDSTVYTLSYYTASGSKSYDAYTGFGHGLVTISLFDTVNHKISGTFSGTLLNDYTPNSDSIVITNGKFNTAYAE